MNMYAESRGDHAEVLRAIRAQHGPGNGQVVPKNDDYENVAKTWCKHAVVRRLMTGGLFRVNEFDPEHVKVLDVMDQHRIDLARNAGIPTSGALCAKQTPSKFQTVSAASL
jgi:hypothetical protein